MTTMKGLDKEAFGQRLRQLMFFQRITQKNLAVRTGVSTASISYYVRGEVEPPLSFAVALVRQFPTVNLRWLLTGQGAMAMTDGAAQQIAVTDLQVGSDGRVLFSASGENVVCHGGLLPESKSYFATKFDPMWTTIFGRSYGILIWEEADAITGPGYYMFRQDRSISVAKSKTSNEGVRLVSGDGETLTPDDVQVIGRAKLELTQI